MKNKEIPLDVLFSRIRQVLNGRPVNFWVEYNPKTGKKTLRKLEIW